MVGDARGHQREDTLDIANTLFQQHKRKLYTWTYQMVNTEIRMIIFFPAKDGGAVYSQQKKDWNLLSNSDLN